MSSHTVFTLHFFQALVMYLSLKKILINIFLDIDSIINKIIILKKQKQKKTICDVNQKKKQTVVSVY